MVRKQVYLEASHERVLKDRARQYRVTEAQLIRRSIDQALKPGAVDTVDPAAWKELKRRIARRRKSSGPATIRSWTRAALYDR
ncbi:MAG: hypothetical protein HY727_01520 [Candidatus Rokubacteria bacterium]|nr:hypothetical protein [Candidatus Rokubacteria bacterium]